MGLVGHLRESATDLCSPDGCCYAESMVKAADEIERLQALLKPFVTAANNADGYPDNHPIGCDPCMSLEGLTVGSLRHVRAALEQGD